MAVGIRDHLAISEIRDRRFLISGQGSSSLFQRFFTSYLNTPCVPGAHVVYGSVVVLEQVWAS